VIKRGAREPPFAGLKLYFQVRRRGLPGVSGGSPVGARGVFRPFLIRLFVGWLRS